MDCQLLFGHDVLFMKKQIDIMIPYADFKLTEKQIQSIKETNRRRLIAAYIKEHGIEPDSEMSKSFYTASNEQLEMYRRAYYANKYKGDKYPDWDDDEQPSDTGSTADSGSTIDSGSTADSGSTIDSGSTVDSGGTIDSGSTEESATTRPLSQFVLSLAEIPCTIGDGNWSEHAIDTIREGIMNGDLLDYTSAEITLSGDNGNIITITDLTKTYYIPDGEYTAKGWIGRIESHGRFDYHDWGWPQYEKGFALVHGQFIIDDLKKTIPLTIEINDAIVVSDKAFYGKTSGSPNAAYGYKNNYYFFVRNVYRETKDYRVVSLYAIPMTFLFDDIEYKIDSFDMGSAYCY